MSLRLKYEGLHIKVENFKRFSLKMLPCEAKHFLLVQLHDKLTIFILQKTHMHMNLDHVASSHFVLTCSLRVQLLAIGSKAGTVCTCQSKGHLQLWRWLPTGRHPIYLPCSATAPMSPMGMFSEPSLAIVRYFVTSQSPYHYCLPQKHPVFSTPNLRFVL